jgi:hypothetical protein
MFYAISDLASRGVESLHVASAYVSWGGSRLLLEAVQASVGEDEYRRMRKRLVTSLDFGLTEPEALRGWLRLPGAEVHVAGAAAVRAGHLSPTRAFHPKLYLFPRPGGEAGLLVGSANLTARGLSSNCEAGWVETALPTASALAAFETTLEGTERLAAVLVDDYERVRTTDRLARAADAEAVAPVPDPDRVDLDSLQVFRESVEAGAVDPSRYEAMWVQVEGLAGGAQNQQELPRLGHRFFGLQFDAYGPEHAHIGALNLRSGSRAWEARALTWHGHNRMERLNLPTQPHGGVDYANTAVLFRRLQDGNFEFVVAPWNSDLSKAWRRASAERGLQFRLGRRSNRVVGLL